MKAGARIANICSEMAGEKAYDSISADYYPEGEQSKGYMKIRLTDGEITEHKDAGDFFAVHVLYELQRLSKMNNPPVEKTVIWY